MISRAYGFLLVSALKKYVRWKCVFAKSLMQYMHFIYNNLKFEPRMKGANMSCDISVIVAFDNNDCLMANFLDQLLPATNWDDKEIVLSSDHCLNEDTLQVARNAAAKHDFIKLVENNKKLGYSKANNVAVDASVGKYLLFMNTDIFPEHGSIEALRKVFETTEHIGCAQGPLAFPQTYKIQNTGHVFNDYMNHHCYGGRLLDDAVVKQAGTRQALNSAFLMMPRAIFEEAGRFNEFYFNAYDGMELTLKIGRMGYKLLYVPEALAFHSTGGSRDYISHNNEYQSKYFYAHLGKDIVTDLPEYLAPQLESANVDFNAEYTVIDCTFSMTWAQLLSDLKLAWKEHVVVFDRDKTNVDFYRNLRPEVKSTPGPILFLVNHFADVAANKRWFKERAALGYVNDIVIDFYGNAGRIGKNELIRI